MKNKKSFINSPFFCSEFQSVSRIMKIVHSGYRIGTYLVRQDIFRPLVTHCSISTVSATYVLYEWTATYLKRSLFVLFLQSYPVAAMTTNLNHVRKILITLIKLWFWHRKNYAILINSVCSEEKRLTSSCSQLLFSNKGAITYI